MTPQEKIIQGLQLQNSGLESSLDIIRGHYEALEERNKLLWAHADGLKIALLEAKKALKPKHSTAIHEPSEQPSVRWVTYRNFLQAVNSLRNQIRKLEDQDDHH